MLNIDGDVVRAATIAARAHRGQTDHTGRPYFEHCARVAAKVNGVVCRQIAYLHDIIEKGPGWTSKRLRENGFSEDVVTAVEALTRNPEEPELDFIRRAAGNVLARPVKKADLTDNLTQARRAGHNPDQYLEGLRILAEEGQ